MGRRGEEDFWILKALPMTIVEVDNVKVLLVILQPPPVIF